MRAGKGGAIKVILDAMKTHSKNAGVCKAGCWALGNIAANGKQIEAQMKRNHFQNITADNQMRAGKEGAIEVVLNVMRTHSKNAGVCEVGCRALWSITANGKQIEA